MKSKILLILSIFISTLSFSQGTVTNTPAPNASSEIKANNTPLGKSSSVKASATPTLNQVQMQSIEGVSSAIVNTAITGGVGRTRMDARNTSNNTQGSVQLFPTEVRFDMEDTDNLKFGIGRIGIDSIFFKSLNDDNQDFSQLKLKPISIEQIVEKGDGTDKSVETTTPSENTIIIISPSSELVESKTSQDFGIGINNGSGNQYFSISTTENSSTITDIPVGGTHSFSRYDRPNESITEITDGTVSAKNEIVVGQSTMTATDGVTTATINVNPQQVSMSSPNIGMVSIDGLNSFQSNISPALEFKEITDGSNTATLTTTPSESYTLMSDGTYSTNSKSTALEILNEASDGTNYTKHIVETFQAVIESAEGTFTNNTTITPYASESNVTNGVNSGGLSLASDLISMQISLGTNTSTTTVTPTNIGLDYISDGESKSAVSVSNTGLYFKAYDLISKQYDLNITPDSWIEGIAEGSNSVAINKTSTSVSCEIGDGTNNNTFGMTPSTTTSTIINGAGISEIHKEIGLIESKVEQGSQKSKLTQTYFGFTSEIENALGASSISQDVSNITAFASETLYLFAGPAGIEMTSSTIGVDVARLNYNSSEVARKNDTGWASYKDNQYTSVSPFAIASGVTSTLPNNSATVINSELPSGVTSFYNSATSKLTPQLDGDYNIFTIRFKAKNSATMGAYMDFGIDIGGSMGVVFKETKVFPKGAGVEHSFTITCPGYSGATFVANGGLVKLTAGGGNIEVYDIEYQITRTHKKI